MTEPRATVAILSIGQMGHGVAKLLIAHNYRVITNVSDRSPATQARAQQAHIESVASDEELVTQSDYIFSIVPPKDAAATASRILKALQSTPAPRHSAASPLYYLDLNAVSPRTVSTIAAQFAEQTPDVRFVDGGIIGGPPTQNNSDSTSWTKPGVPLSGPYALYDAPISGAHLTDILNTNHLGPKIGSASGLKCCFAALAKGTTALALQSFSTAASLDVLPALEQYLDEYNPEIGGRVRKTMPACPPKAYRWIEEMHQIGECFSENGGWAEQASVFREIAGVYEELANLVERRGGTDEMKTVGDVVGALKGGLGGEEDLGGKSA